MKRRYGGFIAKFEDIKWKIQNIVLHSRTVNEKLRILGVFVMKKLMTGNEAVARGAYEAGCHIATGYPGTPSTEILENLAHYYKEVYSAWSPNEKVAVEVACGASAVGARALSTMKVIGLNVAMDPLMTFSYMGVVGGLVILVADDPGCSSSQTEQDNRLIAPFAKIPMLEPSDSQECKDYIKLAFEISERFDIPVLFRMTTRVCHSKSVVELGEPSAVPIAPYKNSGKYCSGPALSRKNHARLEAMLLELERYAENCPANRIEWGDKEIGIITSGISYQHAKEVFGDKASYLKLGLTHRLPQKLILDFCAAVKTVYVIEENEPFLENAVRLMGISCVGKGKLPISYELSPEILRRELLGEQIPECCTLDAQAPVRPPILCAGCPHRSIFYAVAQYKDIVAANDIGCYTLGMVPPLGVTDTIICMGAGISAGIGLERALRLSGQDKKVFGFIGDSTFFHSGITGLIDAVWNNANMTVCVLDNSTTAMTGHQEHPGTGKTLMGEATPKLDIIALIRACGVADERIHVVDAYDLVAVTAAVDICHKQNGVSVIITKQPCALVKDVAAKRAGMACAVVPEKCKFCKLCLKVGCPALVSREGKISIERASCNGCGICLQTCKFAAIERMDERA